MIFQDIDLGELGFKFRSICWLLGVLEFVIMVWEFSWCFIIYFFYNQSFC